MLQDHCGRRCLPLTKMSRGTLSVYTHGINRHGVLEQIVTMRDAVIVNTYQHITLQIHRWQNTGSEP